MDKITIDVDYRHLLSIESDGLTVEFVDIVEGDRGDSVYIPIKEAVKAAKAILKVAGSKAFVDNSEEEAAKAAEMIADIEAIRQMLLPEEGRGPLYQGRASEHSNDITRKVIPHPTDSRQMMVIDTHTYMTEARRLYDQGIRAPKGEE